MSKTKLSGNNGGWYPIIRDLVWRYDSETAMTYGVVWRMCQRRYRICYASLETITIWTGLGQSTVQRRLKILIEGGYIILIHRGRTNVYEDTGKAGLDISAFIDADELNPLDEDEINEVGQTEHIPDTSGQPDHCPKVVSLTTIVVRETTESGQPDHQGLDNKDKINKDDGEKKAPKTKTPRTTEEYRREIMGTMERGASDTEIIRESVEKRFHIYPNWQTRGWNDILLFIRSRPEGQTLDRFADWWFENDWRGKEGQPPTCTIIRELWPQAFKGGGDLYKQNPDGSWF